MAFILLLAMFVFTVSSGNADVRLVRDGRGWQQYHNRPIIPVYMRPQNCRPRIPPPVVPGRADCTTQSPNRVIYISPYPPYPVVIPVQPRRPDYMYDGVHKPAMNVYI